MFDEAARHPAQLLHQMPPCFSTRQAVLGVRYDNFRISGLLTTCLVVATCLHSQHLLAQNKVCVHHTKPIASALQRTRRPPQLTQQAPALS